MEEAGFGYRVMLGYDTMIQGFFIWLWRFTFFPLEYIINVFSHQPEQEKDWTVSTLFLFNQQFVKNLTRKILIPQYF